MPTRRIILKAAPKRRGTVSRSSIRRVVQSVFGGATSSTSSKPAEKWKRVGTKPKALAAGVK